MRGMKGAVTALLLLGGPAAAEVEELFSRHVQVLRPVGTFAQRLIKVEVPNGDRWHEFQDSKRGIRILLPATAQADTAPSGSRILQVAFSDSAVRPRPVLRIDTFVPQQGDPTEIDPDYAATYAEEYPQTAFGGKFTVTDSGQVVKKKQNFALVGGGYSQGAAAAHRLQVAYLSREQQLFVTFDCSEGDWERYQDTLAAMLLSLEIGRRKGK